MTLKFSETNLTRTTSLPTLSSPQVVQSTARTSVSLSDLSKKTTPGIKVPTTTKDIIVRNPASPSELSKVLRTDYAVGNPVGLGFTKRQGAATAVGVGVGVGLATLAETTGLNTTLHEYVGHGYLGGHLTMDYTNGHEPIFQVDGWDNFQAMLDAEGAPATKDAILNWLSGHDVGQDGASGWAAVWGGEPNELGAEMGSDGQGAWISVAGSLPGMVTNSLVVMGGMKLRKTNPALAYSILSFGGTMHLINSAYPISAAVMGAETLELEANRGHDFANFAVRMGEVTGLAPQAVAIMCAGLWVGIIPGIALAMYLHEKSSQDELVPDHIALGHWLSQAKDDEKVAEVFDGLLEKYPEQKQLKAFALKSLVLKYKLDHRIGEKESVLKEFGALNIRMTRAQDKFNTYLLSKIPSKTINRARADVLTRWGALTTNKKLRTAMVGIQAGGFTLGVLSQLFGLLGRTIVAGLAPVATALSYAFPVFQLIGAGFSAYDTSRDLRSPVDTVPRSAKVLSVLKTTMVSVSSVMLIIGICVPGLGALILPGILVGLIGALGFGFAKTRIIRHRFDVHQSVKPVEWNYMSARYENYLESFEDGKSSWRWAERSNMKRWVKLQKSAAELGLLNDPQRERLGELGVEIKPLVPTSLEVTPVKSDALSLQPVTSTPGVEAAAAA